MNKSESIMNLATALALAQGKITGANKDAFNPHFKSNYADLASVWNACRTQLSENGLAVIQTAHAEGSVVSVETMLAHKSGEWISDTLSLAVRDVTPQSIGSLLTYLRRYALSALVGVAPEDDDGEAAQKEYRDQQQAPAAARPTPPAAAPKPAAAPPRQSSPPASSPASAPNSATSAPKANGSAPATTTAAPPKPAPTATNSTTSSKPSASTAGPASTTDKPVTINDCKAAFSELSKAIYGKHDQNRKDDIALMVWWSEPLIPGRLVALRQALSDVQHANKAVGEEQAYELIRDIADRHGFPGSATKAALKTESENTDARKKCADFVAALRATANGEVPASA